MFGEIIVQVGIQSKYRWIRELIMEADMPNVVRTHSVNFSPSPTVTVPTAMHAMGQWLPRSAQYPGQIPGQSITRRAEAVAPRKHNYFFLERGIKKSDAWMSTNFLGHWLTNIISTL